MIRLTLDAVIITVALNCVLIDAYGSEKKVEGIYKPFGPIMCRLVCQKLSHPFIYNVEKLSCRRFSSSDASVRDICSKEESFICAKRHIIENNTRHNIFGTINNVEHEQRNQPLNEPPTDVLCVKHQGLFDNITLYQACEKGMLCMVKYIVLNGLDDINCQGKWRFTPVMAAASTGQIAVFDFLVSQGCNLSGVNNDKNNILHVACDGGNPDIVSKLVDSGKFNIDSKGSMEMTPVMFAVLKGHREVFDLLVEKACNLTALDHYQRNILHVACMGGHVDLVKCILSKGITSIECRENEGRTPVLEATARGKVPVVEFLVHKGCNLKTRDQQRRNILHFACFSGKLDMVKYIVSKRIDGLDSGGYMGRTPVMLAAQMGHLEIVDLLVNKSYNLKALDNSNNNILHIACIGGHLDVVRYILSKRIAGIDSKGFVGRTPVMQAVLKSHVDIVEFLIRKGCNLKIVDNESCNILFHACAVGSLDIVRYILSKKLVDVDSRGFMGRTPIMQAAMNGHRRVFDFLVSKGCNLTIVTKQGNSLINIACIGHVNMVKYILSKHMAHLESKGYQGRTSVMIAAAIGNKAVVEFLVSKGCNLKEIDDDGNTILHLACSGGHVDVVKFLVKLKDVKGMEKVKNKFKYTPVQLARKNEQTMVVSFLNKIREL